MFPRFLLILAVCLPAALPQSAPDRGAAVFRTNCAFCHGLTGQGGRGPDLTRKEKVHGNTAEAIRDVIQHGVPGTTMPAFSRMDKQDLAALVAYVMAFSERSGPEEKVTGDPAKGKALYARLGCSGCHRIGTAGSVFGPNLTRVGSGRSLRYLRESILDPSADVPEEYEAVTVVTNSGRTVSGIRINEDTFTIQLRDLSQEFRMFVKSDLKQVRHESKSLMPPYKNLPPSDLNDLIAYLASLKGQNVPGGETKAAEGIR